MSEAGENAEDPNLRHVKKVTTLKRPFLSESMNEFYEKHS